MLRYYDNTRVAAYSECERKFYFRHVRNWVSDGVSLPLAFGLSWHSAMDVVWPNIDVPTEKLANLALAAFEQTWQEAGLPLAENASIEELDGWGYRNPGTAFEMIVCYIEIRRPYIQECEILAVEKPFAAAIRTDDPDLFYIGRIDKVVRKDGRIKGIEHKTSSLYKKDGPFRADFIDDFSPNNQIDGYTHGLNMNYQQVDMILVDAVLVHKTIHDAFKFIPVKRATAHLDAWLWEVNDRIDKIEADKLRLLSYREWARVEGRHASYLPAFPKQPSECIGRYGHCPYLDLCKMEPNPETIEHVPDGFKVEKWEPFATNCIATLGLDDEN